MATGEPPWHKSDAFQESVGSGILRATLALPNDLHLQITNS